MKIKFRRGKNSDLDNIYELHTRCFSPNDHWYKSAIGNFLDNSIVIEINQETITNPIIGVLLQGLITPCNKKFNLLNGDSSGYKEDVFEPVNETGKYLQENDLHYNEYHGILMICVDPNYRGKGLAKRLIEKHFKDSTGRMICLNTRKSNIHAYLLYKHMGYEHVAYIKNKYFQPNEDSIFMMKNLAESK